MSAQRWVKILSPVWTPAACVLVARGTLAVASLEWTHDAAATACFFGLFVGCMAAIGLFAEVVVTP